MPETFGSRVRRAWDAFRVGDPLTRYKDDLGPSYSTRPDHLKLRYRNERTIASSIYTRIALDVAATTIQHVRLDENGRFVESIHSGLSDCLNIEANKDQTGKAFIQDVVMSMFDEGVVAIVPVDATYDIRSNIVVEIETLRTAKILQWYPDDVRLELYNDRIGLKEEITLPKKHVGIIENPLYAVINDPNSTLQRLIYKLGLLDAIDAQNSTGKLDLIIQLPYVIKSDMRRQQAEKRRKELEDQLAGSKYGIAYTDGTERITQLNRAVDNNLMAQIEYLTAMLYSQLGLTQSVFDGTADDGVMTNYYARTVQPVANAIADELHRKYLSDTQKAEHEAIRCFRDPFSFVPVSKIAEIADKFTRNEIMSSNEVRQIIGMQASEDPGADELRNKNLSMQKTGLMNRQAEATKEERQNGG